MASIPQTARPQRQVAAPDLGGNWIAWSAGGLRLFALAIAAGVMAFLQIPSVSKGQEPPAASAEPLSAVQILERASQARLRLTRGEFTAIGEWTNEPRQVQPPQENLRGSTELYCAFDTTADRMRFDRHDDELLREKGQVTVLDGVWRRYINAPELSVWWRGNQRFAVVAPQNATPPQGITPFDVRLLGMMSNVSLNRASRDFGQVFQYYAERTGVTIDHEREEIVCLCWVEPAPPVQSRTRIWFDAEADYSPIRYELSYSRSIETPFEWGEPHHSVGVTWKRTNAVVVPVSYRAMDRSPKWIQRTLMLLEWTAVNAPLDDKIFTLDGFDLPPGIAILDKRGGKIVVVER
jgi:hypothetical protein